MKRWLLAAFGVSLLGCAESVAEGPADARAGDATTLDATKEAAADVQADDAMDGGSDVRDAKTPDGSDAVSDAPPDVPDSNPLPCGSSALLPDSGAGCALDGGGCPLLVTDTGGTIYALDTSGTTVAAYSFPMPNVVGVAHDPAGDGFWVNNTDALLAKVGWDGTLLRCYEWDQDANGTARGLAFEQGPFPALHFVVTHPLTSGQAVVSVSDSNGVVGTTNFFNANPQDAGPDAGDVDHWDILFTGARLVSYNFAGAAYLRPTDDSQLASAIALPAGVVVRGAAPKGTGYYVVDAATHRLVEVNASGAQVSFFTLPGSAPSDVSYAP